MDMGQRKMSNFRTPINARYNVVAFITKLPKCKRVASTRAKKILEQISKPCFFTEFKNRGLFSTAQWAVRPCTPCNFKFLDKCMKLYDI